ncbi:MAG: ParA family protein, partial [bacterium]|nr:ParA family protein [bacterium]
MFTITFYSYKGGVGRTLALANTAYSLATGGDGSKVVIIDFDLEAPGIDSISPYNEGTISPQGGIIEYIMRYYDDKNPDPADLTEIKPYSYTVPGLDNIRVIPAGKKDLPYQ